MAEALIRSAGGNARQSIVMPTGVMRPPPTPCRTRKAVSSLRLVATPQSADAAVNMNMAVSSTRRGPKRSPSQPDAGMNTARLTRNPITTVSSAVELTWKSRPRVGRATLTIVVSRIAINMAAT